MFTLISSSILLGRDRICHHQKLQWSNSRIFCVQICTHCTNTTAAATTTITANRHKRKCAQNQAKLVSLRRPTIKNTWMCSNHPENGLFSTKVYHNKLNVQPKLIFYYFELSTTECNFSICRFSFNLSIVRLFSSRFVQCFSLGKKRDLFTILCVNWYWQQLKHMKDRTMEFNANDCMRWQKHRNLAHPFGVMLAITMNTLCRLRQKRSVQIEHTEQHTDIYNAHKHRLDICFCNERCCCVCVLF